MVSKADERFADLILHYRILLSLIHAKLKILEDEIRIREKIRKLEDCL